MNSIEFNTKAGGVEVLVYVELDVTTTATQEHYDRIGWRTETEVEIDIDSWELYRVHEDGTVAQDAEPKPVGEERRRIVSEIRDEIEENRAQIESDALAY